MTLLARIAFAVLALLLGLVPQVHAGPPLIAPAVEVQAPDLQPAPVVRVYLIAYRAHGPPSGALLCVVRTTSSRSAWCIQYGYCGGDPVNRWDPSGLDWEYVAGGGGVVGGWWDTETSGGWRYIPGTPARVPKPHDDITPAMLGLNGNRFTEAHFKAGLGGYYDRWYANFDLAPANGGPIEYGSAGNRQTLMVPGVGAEKAVQALNRAVEIGDDLANDAADISRGVGQGALNTVNGTKNVAFSITDLPRQGWNAGQWWVVKGGGLIGIGGGGRGAWVDGDWSIPQTNGMRNWNANVLVDDSMYNRQLSETLAGSGVLLLLPTPKIIGAGRVSDDMVLVARFADRAAPESLLPNIAKTDASLGSRASVWLQTRVPSLRARLAEAHSTGDVAWGQSPFVSVGSDIFSLARTTDPWLGTIATGRIPGSLLQAPGVMRAPDIGFFFVPRSSLIRPANGLASTETELLYLGKDLQRYVVRWIENPFH